MLENKHLDPPRYPKLIIPLEEMMKKTFAVTTSKILVDVTKQLVKEVKEK
jgi:hypothetical protein